MVRVPSAEGDREGVVTRAPVGLRHANAGKRRRRAEGGDQLGGMRRERRCQQPTRVRTGALRILQWPDARVRVYLRELVQAEDVHVVETQRHLRAQLFVEADVELLRVRRL